MIKAMCYVLGFAMLAFLVATSLERPAVSAQQHSSVTIEPFMVKDINLDGDSNPGWFAEMGGKIYFAATTEEQGRELWVTDGTDAGTHLVKDINPVVGKGIVFGSNPRFITVYNDELYFQARTILEGTELWKSDGTEAGTVMVKNIHPEDGVGGAESSEPHGFVEFNGELFFAAKDSATSAPGLWKTDGTEAGTVRVGTVFVRNFGYSSPVVFGDAMYFGGSLDPVIDVELWKSDGTATGTFLVKEINPDTTNGPASSSPKFFTVVNNTLFFAAVWGVGEEELWKSDGTEAGTVLVKDIRPGDESSFPDRLVNMNGVLYFRASDGSENSYELWRSDGTEMGTYMVKNINPEPNYGGFSTPFLYGRYITLPTTNNELYFYGNDLANGDELWKSDGTEDGTVLIKDIFPGSDSSSPSWLISDGNKVYFTANDGENGVEIWQSDGTELGTEMLKDIAPGIDSSDPHLSIIAGNWLVFSADDGVHGRELWMMLLTELDEKTYLPIVLQQ